MSQSWEGFIIGFGLMLSDYKEKLEKGEGLGLDWIMSRSEGNSTIKYPNPCSGGGKNKMELGNITGNTLKSQFLQQQYGLLKNIVYQYHQQQSQFFIFSVFSLFFF